jgi:hypothetical protein
MVDWVADCIKDWQLYPAKGWFEARGPYDGSYFQHLAIS